ncbi:hypothetical protein SB768_30815 [Burkholderia sp. SIMBA_043]|jgi:site-specific recombinase XerD|uniref:hypothetical protein n=1 Tax=Burkholderia TaxID=32008 RepID=UPI0005DA1206|nr:hypothetical protein [Burkholderia vietnamiensis]AJY08608.1 putative site-specific recombinase [Burkholderia vietnamiensis LMG 10929]AOK44592.1 hypothetical protein WL96_25875 [Burkholderia vietnamiensis]AVR14811.1 hypothetical protein A8H33_15490 [Burkholderia vietnamiensis]KVE60750.1 hypothetical protein WI96_26360 [Burkholderia vietnamiensis]KVM58164.1 hypothetical protein WJ57_00045 [Burkholderia vietnamiensis]
MPNVIKRAAVLSPGQIRHLLRVTEATSRHPARDAVILLFGLSGGATLEQVQLLLRHESIDDTRRYIDVESAVLSRIFEAAI